MKIIFNAWAITYGMAYLLIKVKGYLGFDFISDNVIVIGWLLILITAFVEYFGIRKIEKLYKFAVGKIEIWCEHEKSK